MKISPEDRRKYSAASSVANQAKLLKASTENVKPLAQTRVETGTCSKTGNPTLKIVYPPRAGGVSQKVDASYLLDFPRLNPLFSEAFKEWGGTQSPATRKNTISAIGRAFFSFLHGKNLQDLQPVEIDEDLLFDFKKWLISAKRKSGKTLSSRSVGHYLTDLRAVLYAIEGGAWMATAHAIAERIPGGVWGAHIKTEPIVVLAFDSLVRIIEAAENEILKLETRFSTARAAIAAGVRKLNDPARLLKGTYSDFKDPELALAALSSMFPNVVPDLEGIKSENVDLGNAVQYIHGKNSLVKQLYPSARDLVPFVVLLTICTVFNVDTILPLNWSNIDLNKDRAGSLAVEIIGEKGRGAADLVRLLDPDGSVSTNVTLSKLLNLLRDITGRIRPAAIQGHSDRVFLYVPLVRTSHIAKGWGSLGEVPDLPSNDMTWKDGLSGFIKDNKVQTFTLGQLRPTILDLVQMMDGSLESAQRVGNHRNAVTTWTFYTSGGVKKRLRERVGQVLMLRGRWLETNGAIDPRRLLNSEDKGAATPGFICLDPFDSPRPNQTKGRLCKDYGGCPSCPLAAARPYDVISVGYYLALEIAIYESQASMSSRTWLERWAPILADLQALLKHSPQDCLDKARSCRIHLPKVG